MARSQQPAPTTCCLLPFAHWQRTIAHGLPLSEQQGIYEQLVAPESRRVLRDALTPQAAVNFHQPHAPLLLLAGGADRLLPAALNYANYRRYTHLHFTTHYQVLPGRTHLLLGQPTWLADAALIARWLHTHAKGGMEPAT